MEKRSKRYVDVPKDNSIEKSRNPIMQVIIDMARHSIKAKETQDGRVPLSSEGMSAAVEKGESSKHSQFIKDKAGKVETLTIFGSPRERTTQSSLLRMFGELFKGATFKDVAPNELVEWLKGSGILESEISPLLDFKEGEGEYKKELYDNFLKGEYLSWLVNQSDNSAIKYNQKADMVTPYSIQAANVASFIWALGVYKAKQLLNNDKADKVDLAFATSHQGVLESLLLKIISIQEGEKGTEEFIQDLDNKGFKENEGYGVGFNIYSEDLQDWDVSIIYKKKKYRVTQKELTSIMQEGYDLNQKLENN